MEPERTLQCAQRDALPIEEGEQCSSSNLLICLDCIEKPQQGRAQCQKQLRSLASVSLSLLCAVKKLLNSFLENCYVKHS